MKKTTTYFLILVSLMNCNNYMEAQNINQQKDTIMSTTNFTTTFTVEQSPQEVFKAVTNPRGWWSEEIEGNTADLNGEFLYHYKDVHVTKMQLIEVVPGKKVVWEVKDNYFNFTKDKNEWKGNKVVFEITQDDGKTQLRFTQEGLVPAYECYDICRDAWTNYIKNSLYNLITTGKGKPNPKEGGFNESLLEKYFIK
jgi:uncharacterized protein YndB with AHSA1/START domain